MIRYALKCRDGHVFDSWFQSAAAFDALAQAGHLNCAVCGVAEVEKTLMTPRVAPKGRDEAHPKARNEEPVNGRVLKDATGEAKQALTPHEARAKDQAREALGQADAEKKAKAIAEMRRSVEENATYVGGKFAEKAREMHDGTSTETSIYGEASLAEARALIEEGVPVVPLPFKPKQKMQ